MKMPKKPKPLMSQTAYKKNSGLFCPCCDSIQLSADTPQIDGASVWVGVSCNSCGASWNDVYKLTGYEEFEMNVTVKPMEPFSLGEKN